MPNSNLPHKISLFFSSFDPKIKVTVTLGTLGTLGNVTLGNRLFFKKLGLILSCIFVFSFVWISVSYGQNTAPHFSIAPAKLELEVKRGEEIEDFIRIINRSEVAIPIRVNVLNFTAEDYTGTIQFYSQTQEVIEQGIDDTTFNPAKWITIQNPNFILDPGEVRHVNFRVQVPENAEPGGHYAVVMFEPQLPSYYFEEEILKVVPKIGVLFLFSVKVEGLTRVEEPLTVVEFAIPENLHLKKLENLVVSLAGIISEAQAAEESPFSIIEKSHLSFTLQIKNNDIYHQKLEGSLVILTGNGKVAGETEIKQTTILPGKIRKIPVEFKPNLPEKLEKYLPTVISNFISQSLLWGKYKARLILTTDNITIEEDIEFWVFPWKIWLSTVFVICIIMFLVIKHRRRIKTAIRVLLRAKSLE